MISNEIDKDINLLANTNLNEDTSKDAIAYLVVKNAKLQQENQQLKKQKDDVVEYIKNTYNNITKLGKRDLLRMLGEIE